MAADKETIAEEIRNYFKRIGLRNYEIAEKIGISKSHLSNLLSGRSGFGYITAHKFAAIFPELSVPFLVSGEGQLIGKAPSQNVTNVTNSGNIANGPISINQGPAALAAENAQLREQLARKTEENDRLLGIIDNLTKK